MLPPARFSSTSVNSSSASSVSVSASTMKRKVVARIIFYDLNQRTTTDVVPRYVSQILPTQ
eukprot:COSAG02_NODE_3747_length_6292_cov_3.278379_5_plen_61_part_00